MITWDELQPRPNQSPSEKRFNCNSCDDSRGRLFINKITALYHCFNCGLGGKVPQDYKATVLGDLTHYAPEPARGKPSLTLSPRISYSGREYAKSRHFSTKVAHKWGVRSGSQDCLGRMCFPAKYHYHTTDTEADPWGGTPVCWSAHATRTSIQPKCISYTNLDRMYPMFLARDIHTSQPIYPTLSFNSEARVGFYRWPLGIDVHLEGAILVEGPADAHRIMSTMCRETCHEWAVICLWGKSLSEDDAYMLGTMFPNFYIWFDSDAQNQAKAAQAALSVFTAGDVRRHQYPFDARFTDPAAYPEPVMILRLKEIAS